MSEAGSEVTELPATPGARLRREREQRGLTAQQVAEQLNLDAAVIGAIEGNDYSALGAPVFAKGHLRKYASLLGLPEDEILAGYERAKSRPESPSLVPKSREEMMPQRSRRRWPWVVGSLLLFVLAGLGATWLSEGGLDVLRGLLGRTSGGEVTADGSAAPEVVVAGPTDATPSAASVAEPAPALPPDGAVADADGTSTAPVAAAPPDASATAAPAAGPAAAATPAPGAGGAEPAGAPAQVVLQLRFAADSWVEIYDGAGKAVVYDLGRAGTERTLTALPPLSVTLGNGPAVRVTINGQPAVVPAGDGGQTVARFRVATDGSLR